MTDEQQRLNHIAHWYQNTNWGFYTRLVHYGYQSIKSHLIEGPVLEVGSADGEMTKYIVEDFKQVTVVDAARSYTEAILAKYPQVKVHQSMIENFVTSETYANIIFAHILEHVVDPIRVLKKLGRLIKPGGRIAIIVPNADSLHRLAGVEMGLMKATTELNEADISVDHKRVYTRELLNTHINKANLKLVASGGIFLKPLSNRQIEDQWSDELIEAYYELGKKFPDLAAELYSIVCRK
jgi:2-polyprenyl-3-methyl-5-hydroxy-6-metoxy-1,4-benzoquinol methylase